jgi:DnaK suppressor protein
MGTIQQGTGVALTPRQLDQIRAELERERAHHAGTLRFDVMTAALERLDAGTYGTCLECDTAIPYERLSVMPETDRCVACSPVH